MPSDLCECDCKCARPKQPPGGPESDGRLCANCDGAACDLPPGPTWSEAIAVIRRHDFAAANRLEHGRYLVISRAWSPATWAISQSTALARLESEALDLYEKMREKEATDAE